jgi:hypothetical protein
VPGSFRHVPLHFLTSHLKGKRRMNGSGFYGITQKRKEAVNAKYGHEDKHSWPLHLKRNNVQYYTGK